jgi:hypothetical protein
MPRKTVTAIGRSRSLQLHGSARLVHFLEPDLILSDQTGGWAHFPRSGARGVLMDQCSELKARVDALVARTRALLDELGELASSQRRLRESVAEIRDCLAAVRPLDETNGQTE